MKNKLRIYSLLISGIVSILVFGLYQTDKLNKFENQSLDWRFNLRGVQKPKSPVVVAAIDEFSLESIGKWPWRRSVQAKLVNNLVKLGASAVVFDVIFYEPDNERPWDDRALTKAIKRSKRTVSAFSFDYVEQMVAAANEEGITEEYLETSIEMSDPLPEFADASAALGFVNSFPDNDGGLRRAVLRYQYEGEWYNSFGLQAVAVSNGKSSDEILEGITMRDSEPGGWGYLGREVLVNYRGPLKVIPDGDEIEQYLFPTYSCDQILLNAIDPNLIKDKIVLIGATALATFDHYKIPFQSQYPGVYFHANVIDNLWAKDFLTPVSNAWTILLIFLFAIGCGILIPRYTAIVSATIILSAAALLWGFGYLLMAKKEVYIELVAPSIGLLGSYITVFFYRFLVEQKEKAGIKKAFGVYVNPHVVEVISKNPEALKLGGEKREMTVMFSDVASFTTISEKLSSEELVQLLNIYLTAMTDTIMRLDGTVDKYEGDAIMAFWGAPLVQPQHAKLACTAVLENRERLKELNVDLKKKGMQELFARCGLNTGPMNVGNMGSSQKFNYTVMGDPVNLASRLEGANKQYGTALMISETTYDVVKDDVEARELDLLQVKGKNVPIKVYELVGKKGSLTDSQKQAFDLFMEALELYRKRQFKKALVKFQETSNILSDDGPSQTYMQRCKDYIKSPPPANWDGVFVMTTK